MPVPFLAAIFWDGFPAVLSTAGALAGVVKPGRARGVCLARPDPRRLSAIMHGQILEAPIRWRQELGMPVPSGVVKWFDPERDVGAITQDGGSWEAVAHRSAVHGDADRVLVAGHRVRFDVTQDADGIRADNIHPATRPSCSPAERPQHGQLVWMVPPGLPPRLVPVSG
ncbi:cold shock domain-containing protein [Streptomyces phaeochromogenes]|uniref:cold-shock protein n=1 Tax=Streptomyces phaeochromogenes TaxID=1923 RepID=UPI0038668566|nr:cold shock domain-containing protein [Streptomyces phaeochromogenes]